MKRKLIWFIINFLLVTATTIGLWTFSVAESGKNGTYIVDRTGERWDVNQAESIGFKPAKFQYGIGRYAFTTLDDSHLQSDTASIPRNLRVIGIADYDEDLKAMSKEDKSVEEIYEALAFEDIAMAADLFRPVYDETHGLDGYVSLEVSPQLTHDTEKTVSEAKRFLNYSVGLM